MGDKEKIGSVLVVGGGIAGIQASLDLADSGYKVYLVESKTAIGGHMAQLDKTFPTNDCAMCTISPRLVAAGLHRNIEIITNATLGKLDGDPGNFQATIDIRANFVDSEKCTGCGLCAEACPINVADEYNQGLSARKAIYKLYPQAVPNKFSISKKGVAPCYDACPLHGDPSGYVALTGEGRYQEAIDLLLEKNPFPAICGRICHHPCETQCSRGNLDEPLSIAYIKRFLADWNAEQGEKTSAEAKQEAIEDNGRRVAVVGAGPSGLTAARELRRMGYQPTVFEARPIAGGMLSMGIPAYRLPPQVIEQEITDILDYGVKLEANSPVTSEQDIQKFFDDGFDSVFLSVGAHKGRKLGMENDDLDGISDGVTFLRDIRLGNRDSVKKRVIVVGGGNVAIDCARSALRLGAESVDLVCLESYENMPAHQYEIDWAEQEGVRVNAARATRKILNKDGSFAGLETLDVKRMAFVEGRLELDTEPGTEKTLEADDMIVAIGQTPDLSFIGDNGKIHLTPRGTVEVIDTGMTTWQGVFAGGDMVRGAASVIEAVNDGRQAARAIDAFLQGKEFIPETVPHEVIELKKDELKKRKEPKKPRNTMPERSVTERIQGFDEVDEGFTEAMARDESQRCLYCAICSNCRRCEDVCEANALCYDDQPKQRNVDVGAVIMAPGFELFDSRNKGEYGYKRFPNVVSALDYERLLSASGPTLGHVLRLSDDKEEPKKIAFIQCVGSRDQDHPYCSSVCCTFALKQSIITREHCKQAHCKIFAMDIRAFGKGFDEYYERAKNDYGVEIVYTRPSAVKQNFKNNNLLLQYTEDGTNWTEEEFDMVVLSAGLCEDGNATTLAQVTGIDLNAYDFAKSPAFTPSSTNREGIFLAGTFEEPKDIPETVTQASAAAAQAMELLADVRGSQVQEKTYPQEKDVTESEPRIGVFICHCGSNIAGVINCEEIANYASGLKNVAYTDHLLYTCSPDGLKTIRDKIAEHDLNRVVVASCTPRTHEPLFQENIREAGLNPYLFEMANIRDQCTWVHADMAQMAEGKAIDLVRMAVGRARTIGPLHSQTYVPKRSALVIGGGVAGMTAALSIADQGFHVNLVEKTGALGGHAAKVQRTVEGDSPAELATQLEERVTTHEKIHLHINAEILECNGFIGEFKSRIQAGQNGSSKEIEFEHGVAVVATGANELQPTEYGYGDSDRTCTQHEFEAWLTAHPAEAKQLKEVVMIQCVGSREPDRMVCSRVCCTGAIKNAIALKKLNPDAEIAILYRDIRTYGFREEYYTRAREMGIMFFRYDLDKKPEVTGSADGQLTVSLKDLNSRMDLEFTPDRLVLSAGMATPPETQKVGTAFKVPLNLNGFFLEAHMKLRPVDFASDGIFLCGTCHGPKFVRETVTQAQGAAARAVSVLATETMQISCVISQVNEDKCAACLTCVRTCPYNVPKINTNGVAEIQAAMCHGCGVCASECPAKAITLLHYGDEQVMAKTAALYNEANEKASHPGNTDA